MIAWTRNIEQIYLKYNTFQLKFNSLILRFRSALKVSIQDKNYNLLKYWENFRLE